MNTEKKTKKKTNHTQTTNSTAKIKGDFITLQCNVQKKYQSVNYPKEGKVQNNSVYKY